MTLHRTYNPRLLAPCSPTVVRLPRSSFPRSKSLKHDTHNTHHFTFSRAYSSKTATLSYTAQPQPTASPQNATPIGPARQKAKVRYHKNRPLLSSIGVGTYHQKHHYHVESMTGTFILGAYIHVCICCSTVVPCPKTVYANLHILSGCSNFSSASAPRGATASSPRSSCATCSARSPSRPPSRHPS